MTKLKIALSALILPFLATNSTAMGMSNTQELVTTQVNEMMKRPFKHNKPQIEAPIIDRVKNGTYINYTVASKPQPSIGEIASEQMHDEFAEFKEILQQLDPDNTNDFNVAKEQIDKINTRIENIRKSAITLQQQLQKQLAEDASAEKLSFVKNAADEIMQRPFKHAQHPITIKLTDNPNTDSIGYMDTIGIDELSKTAFSAQANDPFVTITHEIAPKHLLKIANDQVMAEQTELEAMFPTTYINSKQKDMYRELFMRIHCRGDKILELVDNIIRFKLPSIIPVKYLEDDSTLNIDENTSVYLKFKDNKKLEELMTTFKQEPTTLFCHLTPGLANKIRSGEELGEEVGNAFLKEVDTIKTEFRKSKIVKRRRHGEVVEDQHYSFNLLSNSDVIGHHSNYHVHHNKNGYSEQKRKIDVPTILNNNPIAFFKDRETGYKRRKLSHNENNQSQK